MVKRLHARQSSIAPYPSERSGVYQRTVADILTSLGKGPKRYTGMDD